jgi:hypothetical protein
MHPSTKLDRRFKGNTHQLTHPINKMKRSFLQIYGESLMDWHNLSQAIIKEEL